MIDWVRVHDELAAPAVDRFRAPVPAPAVGAMLLGVLLGLAALAALSSPTRYVGLAPIFVSGFVLYATTSARRQMAKGPCEALEGTVTDKRTETTSQARADGLGTSSRTLYVVEVHVLRRGPLTCEGAQLADDGSTQSFFVDEDQYASVDVESPIFGVHLPGEQDALPILVDDSFRIRG